MNQEELFKALAELDPDSVEEARTYNKKAKAKLPIWLKWGALAACAVIIFGVLFAIPALQYGNPTQLQKGLPQHGGNGAATTTTETIDVGSAKGVPGKKTTAATDGTSVATTVKPGDPTTSGADKTTVTSPSGATTVKSGNATSTTTAKGRTTTTTKAGVTTTTRTRRTTPDDLPATTTAASPTRTTRTTRLPDVSSDVSSCESDEPAWEEPCEEPTYDVPTTFEGIRKTLATYPDMGDNPFREHYQLANSARSLQSDMSGYYRSVMNRLLPAENANTVCSPLNTYIAFSMLAEVSGGNTRQQVLNMLGVSSIGSLRSRVSAIWQANYVDEPQFTSRLANSVWLKKGVPYSTDALDHLKNDYFASSFIGTPGTTQMDQALQQWTNDNTGGMLAPYVKDMKTNPDMVFELVSTIYYKAPWVFTFREEATRRETFHGTSGDTTVDMMHNREIQSVYRSDTFTAIDLGLRYGGSMIFLLPNEGVNVNTLLSDPNLMSVVQRDRSDERWSSKDVSLSLPKFSVSAKSDLLGLLRSFGVTDAMDSTKSDFTPLTSDRKIALTKADHAAIVEIDEQGVTAAAYTDQMGVEAMAEHIELVFDRPFMFAVTGSDSSILFAGVVRNIS